MIVFDLRCGHGHVFEAWFASSTAFEDQRSRQLVQCPLCQDCVVEKAVMAPNIARKGRVKGTDPTSIERGDHCQLATDLAALQSKILDGADYVGSDFAERARAMHLGEETAAPIYGEASIADAIELRDEGIAIAPLPFPVIPPQSRN